MNRSKAGKWTRVVVWGLLAATMSIGCNPLNLIAIIWAKDEVIEAKHPLTFPKDSPKKDKEEIVVLILAQGSGREYLTIDRDLPEKLSKTLPEMAKENKDKKKKVRVISPTQLDNFKMKNPRWKQLGAGEIGSKLEADFVLEIELSQVRLYQPNTPITDRIYEGAAEASVNIYEVGADGGTVKGTYNLTFRWPDDGFPRTAAAISEREFKQQYADGLATKIAHQHVDHKKTNTFGSGK